MYNYTNCGNQIIHHLWHFEKCSKCQIQINQAALLQEKTRISLVQYILDQHFVLCLEADLRHITLLLNATDILICKIASAKWSLSNIFQHNYGELQPCDGLLLLSSLVKEDDKDAWSSLCGC